MGSPVDPASQALDRLEKYALIAAFPVDSRTKAAKEAFATVRQRLAEQDTEIQRLTEEREQAWDFGQDMAGGKQAAEAEVQRLREGLREIAEEQFASAALPQRKARALLAGSEAEPVRREVKVDPAMFGESNRLLGEPDGGGA